MNDLSEFNLSHTSISINTATQNAIITAPGAGKRICIDFLMLHPSGGANTVTVQTASTTLVALTLDDQQGMVIENTIHYRKGILTCGVNEAFNITLSAATTVEGFVRYHILD